MKKMSRLFKKLSLLPLVWVLSVPSIAWSDTPDTAQTEKRQAVKVGWSRFNRRTVIRVGASLALVASASLLARRFLNSTQPTDDHEGRREDDMLDTILKGPRVRTA